jgi:hypothetical protein
MFPGVTSLGHSSDFPDSQRSLATSIEKLMPLNIVLSLELLENSRSQVL